MSLEAKLVD